MRAFVARRARLLPAICLMCAVSFPLESLGEPARELPATRLRIRIAEAGIYELARGDLVTAGVHADDPNFDPRSLRLFFDAWKPIALLADSTPASWQVDYALREAALWVSGEDDGRFDANDRVVFYALGPEGYEDLAGASADSLAHSQHPYDRDLYGWLVWGGAPGLRMETRSAAAPEPLADPLVTRAWHRVHVEEDHFFTSAGDLMGWARIEPGSSASVEFDLDLGGEALATGLLRVQLGSFAFIPHGIDVRLNGVLLGRTSALSGSAYSWFPFPNAPLQSHNTLALEDPSAPASWSYTELLELDVAWERPLASDARLAELGWSARPSTPQQVYELQGFGAQEPLLFDVTDAWRPQRLVELTAVGAGATTRWRARHGRGAGQKSHDLAVATPRRLDPGTDLELRTVAPLRAIASSPDMLIVTHPDLLPAAERLAAHRRAHLPGITNPNILVATTRDIYDNFSGGRVDPLAIRNYVKFLYALSPANARRPAYLLLLGDATHDPRQVLSGSPPTLVPALQPAYADARFRRDYAVEDWLGEMQTPPDGGTAGAPYASRYVADPDMAIGRLPAQDLAEAEVMVDKIIAYETTAGFGPWRGRVLMAADDECSPYSSCSETYFTANAEALAQRIPPELDVAKIYMTEYPRVAGQKPAARDAFIRAWSEGCALVDYHGHGSSTQLADEVFLLASDVPVLANGARLPVVLAFHDGEAMFDDPTTRSFHELLVAAPHGGAIAAIGTSTFTYITPGFQLAVTQFSEVFHDGATTQQPIGVVHQRAKQMGLGRPVSINDGYVLLGDPALVLQLPRALVTFTAGADSLFAGHRTRVEGFVHRRGETQPLADFDGTAEIDVFGNADESGYDRTAPPQLHIQYVLPGPRLFQGQVAVTQGRFAIEFTVPRVPVAAVPIHQPGPMTCRCPNATSRLGPGARLAAYAWSATIDASGGRDGVVLASTGGEDSSLAAPRIELSFAGGATRIPSGATLTVQLRDENGIWITGTTPASSILLDFDGAAPLDVTTRYRSQAGADTSGTLAITVPDLTPGAHRARLTASDNLGNAASATLDFEVIDAVVSRLDRVQVSPNPVRGQARFAFVLDVPAEIDLRVFTVAGREVWHARRQHDGLRRGLLAWDGSGPGGRSVASGVYLYKLSARVSGSGATPQERTGKLVVLRD